MNHCESLLTRLTSELTQLAQKTATKKAYPLNFPPLDESPEQGNHFLASLLEEANTHYSPSWSAHMTAPAKLESLIGGILAGLHNGNLLSPQIYPVLADIEKQLLTWLCSLFEQPYGHFVPGGSYGNLEALWQAKQAHADKRTVYCSSAAHYSIAKACQILDLNLVTIKTDNNEQIDVDALNTACVNEAPLAIVATAGTSSTGNFDQLDACITIAKQYEAWIHIDAAWGGAFKILPECENLFTGIASADSLSFDPHKAWAQPKPCSVVFYQKPLAPFLTMDSHYLEHPPSQSLPGSYGGESILPLYLSLIFTGSNSLASDVRYGLDEAKAFASRLIESTDWPVYTSPSGIVCFESPSVLEIPIKRGVVSTSKRDDRTIYRTVFAGSHVKAEAVFTELQPYL